MQRSTLQSKLAVAMWVMTAVSTLTAAILSGSLLVRSHVESIKQQLQATGTSLLALGIEDFSDLEDFQNLNNFIEDALQMDKVDKAVRVYDQSKKLIFTTLGSSYDDLPDQFSGTIKKPFFMPVEGRQRNYETLVMPYQDSGKHKTYYLQILIPLPKYSEVLAHLWWQVLLLLGLLIGISIVLSRVLAKRLLRPVEDIADYLQDMDPRKLERFKPLHLGGQGQYLHAIVEGINLLGTRTREAITQLSKMSRYVAHELRTPLTILRGEAETVLQDNKAATVDYRNVLESSLEEIRRMSEIVNTVLKVGENARSITLFNPRPFDLAKWSNKNKPRWERTLKRPISYDPCGIESVSVHADPDLLYRLVDNLVRNVAVHAPSDTDCKISLKRDSNGARLVVEDSGPGLPPSTIESLNRDGGNSGHAGVGLNLCLKIADICGLDLRFADSEFGGLRVNVGFPSRESA